MIDANGVPVRRRGEGGIYALLDHLLYQAGDLRISGFVQGGAANQAVGRFASHIGAGLTATGVIAGRPDDQFGIAAAMVRNTSRRNDKAVCRLMPRKPRSRSFIRRRWRRGSHCSRMFNT